MRSVHTFVKPKVWIEVQEGSAAHIQPMAISGVALFAHSATKAAALGDQVCAARRQAMLRHRIPEAWRLWYQLLRHSRISSIRLCLV